MTFYDCLRKWYHEAYDDPNQFIFWLNSKTNAEMVVLFDEYQAELSEKSHGPA